MLHLLIRCLLAPLARLVYRPVVEGKENIPPVGPVILASNHLSAIDTAVIPFVTPRRVTFLAKAEYFTGRRLKQRLGGAFLAGLGFVPVERGDAHAGLAALGAARKVLDTGGAFGIYPEGTRSRDGRLYRGHTGVAALALATGAPVVPVALIGTDKVQPVGKRMPRLVKVTVRFGKPLEFSRYDRLVDSPQIRRAVTDEIIYAILELSGQEYVDRYHKHPDTD